MDQEFKSTAWFYPITRGNHWGNSAIHRHRQSLLGKDSRHRQLEQRQMRLPQAKKFLHCNGNPQQNEDVADKMRENICKLYN